MNKQTPNNKLRDEIISLKKTLLNLNFQKSSGQLEKTSKIRETKKKIAKLKTQIMSNGVTNA
tara:strand:+ start:486 stop:671 length:186 start_codon:yes stop_codon:yes gene_type:complete